jgi:phage gpG-like protein
MNYAAIHQFGGTITPKNPGGFLKFRTPSGDFAAVRSVTIPQRKILPDNLSELDADTLSELTQAYLNGKTA